MKKVWAFRFPSYVSLILPGLENKQTQQTNINRSLCNVFSIAVLTIFKRAPGPKLFLDEKSLFLEIQCQIE